jgi:hypothetical protein
MPNSQAAGEIHISVAKAEVNFTHDAEEEDRARGAAADRVLDSAPIEIVRERQPNEKPLFFRLRSGDEQVFVVLQKGLPAAGARVRFVSHQGWTKEAVSDEQGRVSFQIIRDYFPPWSEFQKRFKASFLLIAEASAAEAGSYKASPTPAALSGHPGRQLLPVARGLPLLCLGPRRRPGDRAVRRRRRLSLSPAPDQAVPGGALR